MNYFENDFESSRNAFLNRAGQVIKYYEGSQLTSILMPPKNTESLYTDILYVPAAKPSSKLIMITSGVHGIEGYTGSAIQNMLIDKHLLSAEAVSNKIEKENNNLAADLDVSYLFIHSVNPYGQKYFRRVNENNVDLNRNFLLKVIQFSPMKGIKNPAYREINHLLNPDYPFEKKNFEKIRFIYKIQKIISKKGIGKFRQAILQGQYELPKGIFFGGDIYQKQKESIDFVIKKYFTNHSEIIFIDIHTGYGYRGKLHLIGMSEYPDKSIKDRLNRLYYPQQIEAADTQKGDFYKIYGSLFDYVYDEGKYINKPVYPVAWEFGTNNNIRTLKSLESLQIMIQENQAFHFGYKNHKSYQKLMKRFRNLFYPESKRWQKKVLKKAAQSFDSLLQNLKE
jgi:hypothetical protein